MFYLVKSPFLLRKFYPGCTWDIKTNEKIIYLTFDDGPSPGVTPFVLDQLKQYDALATFFCIGKNVKNHFDLYQRMIAEGHKPGNHTYQHLNGWKVKDKDYINDISQAAEVIDSDLFRPPYGRITKFQLKVLRESSLNLKPVMWSVLSGDFDEKLSAEHCYLNVVNHVKPGSIVVFHDSLKAFGKLREVLPKILSYYNGLGYQFKKLTIP